MATVTTTHELIPYKGDNDVLVRIVTTEDESGTTVSKKALAAFFEPDLATFVLNQLGVTTAQD